MVIMINCPTNRLTSTAVYPAPDVSAWNILHTPIAPPQKTMANQILSGIHDHDLVPLDTDRTRRCELVFTIDALGVF
jgi:hypothetical protein